MEIIIQTLVTILSLAAMMYGMLKFMLRDMHKDMLRLEEEQKTARLRTDHLYEMICKLFQDNKRA